MHFSNNSTARVVIFECSRTRPMAFTVRLALSHPSNDKTITTYCQDPIIILGLSLSPIPLRGSRIRAYVSRQAPSPLCLIRLPLRGIGERDRSRWSPYH